MKLAKPETFGAESEEVHTILGPESSFEGKLVFQGGRVRIDGTFKGEIKTESTLIVGEAARVEANLQVGSVLITGEVKGDIIAKTSVGIEKPGRVRGNIVTPELMIDKGVLFDGTCKMTDVTQAAAQPVRLVNADAKPRLQAD